MRAAVFGLLALGALAPILHGYRRGRAARNRPRQLSASAPARWPTVSVIIPAWREQGTLVNCLNCLAKADYAGECEVVVVAGGDDGTLEAAQAFAETSRLPMTVLTQRAGGGKNVAMNDGAAVAKGDVLILLDADTLIAPDWLTVMVAPLENGYAASTGRFVPTQRTLISRALEMGQELEYEARARVQLQGSGGVAVRREAFDVLGGIPTGAPYADDWDLSVRLEAAGYSIAFAPTALSYTERPSNLSEWWRNELRWRRIHLISLFRIADITLADPLTASRTLYPYVTAWGALAASLMALLARGPHGAWTRGLWLLGIGPILSRELAGPVEVAAYTGRRDWLAVFPLMPLLTVLGWAAAALATLTAGQARHHFKGPRRSMTRELETLLIGGVE